ncbi:MAG: FAD-dependent oxidoreductase [Betaproteobacteria bacterium]|nr:FAD-dependent oxidoreductase [Betaproteobacteria bacterium]MBI2961451.1 FAD-dependent oxidoreductase [Betaproteobacteria bacterium]
MSRIVILGAGVNGLSMAYEMRELARAGDRITVVANDPLFRSALGPWEAPRTRPDGDIEFALGPRLARKGIDFTAAGARRLHPGENRIELGDGASLDYDFLVIAAGPKLAFSEIEGLGPGGYTHAVCHVDQAVIASEAWERFVADPGPIVVGTAPGATCFGPAYQLALAIESDLHRRGIRERVDMSFVTAEPHIGHLGLGGSSECRTLLESALRKRSIRWITNARVTRVEAGRMHVSERDAGGGPKQEHVLAFKYSVMLPASRSIDAIAGIDGLVNQCGFVLIDDYLRNPRYGNIYAVGVSVAPAKEAPAPPGTAKIGCSIESVVTAAANNIRAQLDGGAPTHKPIWNALSVADLGAAGIAFVEQPQTAAGDSLSAGGWLHLPQCACCEGGGGELPQAHGLSRPAA